jgi:short subunit dehydrogenase-like uncharacterized protein
MPGRIVVFGATGYTGGLVAEALVARGATPVLAARSRPKLEALAQKLGQPDLEIATADVGDPQSVRSLVEKGDVLVSTVGPFTRWGEPAVKAAIDAGAHYLDSTGEPPFIRAVFERHGIGAKAAGVGLVTALGYDWTPGNLAGALALRDAGETASRVELGYFFTGKTGADGMSGGTRASMVGALIDEGFAYHGGVIRGERGAARVGSFEVKGKTRRGISVGASEHFGLPQAYPNLRDVDVFLGWFGPASRGVQAFAAVGAAAQKVPGVEAGIRSLGARVKGSTGGPDAESRSKSGSHVVARASDQSGKTLAEVHVEGVNGYTFTGAMLAWGAIRAAEQGLQSAGALGPVAAFGLDALREGVADAGIAVL